MDILKYVWGDSDWQRFLELGAATAEPWLCGVLSALSHVILRTAFCGTDISLFQMSNRNLTKDE